MSTFIVGAVIAALLIWSFKKTRDSVKSNQCPGCSGGCSADKQSHCKPRVPLQ